MRRRWNVLISAADDGGYTVTCSPTAFGGGSLVGRPFRDEPELRAFLQALGVREEEVAKVLEAVAPASGRRTYTVRDVEFSDEEISRHKLWPV